MPKAKPLIRPVAMPVRVRPDLRRALNDLAAAQGRSLNALCEEALERVANPAGFQRLPPKGRSFGVGSGVEVLEIVQMGQDRWHGAAVVAIDRDRIQVRFLGSKPQSCAAEVLILRMDAWGRSWR